METGEIYRVSGPVVVARGLDAKMYDIVNVGEEGLLGEVIKIDREDVVIQVYEDTSGVKPGEPVKNTGRPLTVHLGPGLLTSIYDGIQRPLKGLKKEMGDFIKRGVFIDGLDTKKKWEFKASVKKGDKISEGEIIGTVQETPVIMHKVMVPPGISGKVKKISNGKFTVKDTVAELEGGEKIIMAQYWPVRKPRPYKDKLSPDIPLITGQRILDTFFPIAKGGTAAIPGGFGTGKTVTQHQLAKWADTDIIIFIGCGERGNEMTEVLEEFPKLTDPKTGKPMMDRTVLIANTSNMPVAAREASIYTGITIAEYYRDMGYDVALMADSTSRWAEAMREISSRLEEMPGEEGYPAYLAAKLSQFYERAGRVECNGRKDFGSITVIGAVSPPGGDFSEPVTQNTLRVAKVFWALDSKLANKRHFPSINWLTSYSLYMKGLEDWFSENVGKEFVDNQKEGMALLQKEAQLQEIVQIVGSDAIPEKDQMILETTRLIREGYLQQNAFHEIDTYCSLERQMMMMKFILEFGKQGQKAVEAGVLLEKIAGMESKAEFLQMKFVSETEFKAKYDTVTDNMKKEFAKLIKNAGSLSHEDEK
ncbi:TPA: ATP synthase subunit A [archaeon]|jgi:V/A-type H+-transporting ATPase subunit A|uniref:A-type ATP synthase subunit A n=1 Tax=Candidatus Undinarchaeum marinum TaxID=2756141 RepID=A0A832XHG5_9ARCH|nr:ATP synthase subunit A [Candidatus Undinarchaeum marinum]